MKKANRWAVLCLALLPVACESSDSQPGGSGADASTSQVDSSASGTDGGSTDAATADSTWADAAKGDAGTADSASADAVQPNEVGDAADGGMDAVSTDAPFVGTLADVGGQPMDSGVFDDTSTPSSDAADTGILPDGDASDNTVLTGEAGSCGGASTSSDPANCGTCGHSCLGGVCVAGQCQPVVLATAPQPFSVVIDDTRVYWGTGSLDPGTVASVGKDGSQFQTIATGLHAPQGVYVDATNVFWVETDAPSGIFKANKDGSNPVTLSASNTCCRQEMVADTNWVYVIQGGSSSYIEKVPRTGVADAGAPTTISDGWVYAAGLAQDATHLYWTSGGNEDGQMGIADGGIPGKIVSMPKDGSTAATVLATSGDPADITVDANAVYWTDRLGFVYRLPFGATVPTVLAHAVLPFGIAVDATYVYFSTLATNKSDGTIVRVAINGSDSPKAIAANLNFPSQVAVDAVAVYWANTWGGTVMKLAK